MSHKADAFVFFGATGDLAHKKIFPALQAMIRKGHLDVPIVGVAKAGWSLEQLRARAKESLQAHGGLDEAAFKKLVQLLRYVDGDYNDASTFTALRKAARRREGAAALPGDPPEPVPGGDQAPGRLGLREGRARHRREAVRARPCVGACR